GGWSTDCHPDQICEEALSFHLRVILIEIGDGLNAFQKVPDPKMLIGGVDGIAVQSKSQQNGLAVKYFFKKGHDRDAPSSPLGNRGFPKSGFHSFGSGLVANIVDRGHISLSAMVWFHFYLHTLWGQ